MFDIYGQQINMQIFGREKKKSLFGAFMGVLSMALMASVTIYFIVGLWQRNTKQIITNQDTTINPYNNFTEFPIFFTMLASSGIYPPNDGTIFNIHAYKLVSNYTNSIYYGASFIRLDLKICSDNSWGKFPVINDNVSPYRMCIKPGDINLYNNINNFKDGWDSLVVIITRCNPSKNANCASQEKIDAAFEGSYFSFGTYFSSIDNNNLTSPGQNFLGTTYVTLSNSLYKKMTVKLTQNLYQDDNGFVFESLDTFNFFTQGDTSTEYSTKYPASYLGLTGETPVGSITVTNTPFVQRHYRSFMKAQVVLANIGGMVKFIMIVAGFVSNFVTRKLAFAEIGNVLFDYRNIGSKLKNLKPTLSERGERVLKRNITETNLDLKLISLGDRKEGEKGVPEMSPPEKKFEKNQQFISLRPRKIKIQNTSLRTQSSKYFNLSLKDMVCTTGWASNKSVMRNYDLTQAVILKKASIDSIAADSYRLDELCKLVLTDDQYEFLNKKRINFATQLN